METRLTEHCNAIKRHNPKSLTASHAEDYEHSFNWSQTEILGQATTCHACEFKEAWHSMDRSTLQQTHWYSHYLPSTQTNSNPPPLIFDSWNSPYKHSKTPQQLENPLLELPLQKPILTRSESMNDNNPVNHQPIRHTKRLESQRRISEHLTPHNPHTSDEDSKHRSRKLKIINWKSREQNNPNNSMPGLQIFNTHTHIYIYITGCYRITGGYRITRGYVVPRGRILIC